jgi:hypothetical protein
MDGSGSQLVAQASHPLGTSEQDQSIPGYSTSVTPVVGWAKIVSAAVVLLAGIMVFDCLILWIASARVIERMPF